MKILLTNDDGIYAEGIKELAKILSDEDHQLAVVAPDRERSAAGHSITIHQPLRVEKTGYDKIQNIEGYKVSGTPADCVKLGIDSLIDFKPDLVISGINKGGNLGYDVLYSGTVSAAIEGWMMGYTSIAVSLKTRTNYDFLNCARIFYDIVFSSIETFIKEKMLLNINIPDIKEKYVEGISITRLGKSLYEDYYETRVDPVGNNYYWLTGDIKGEFEDNIDIGAIKQNKVSITPLQLSLTNNSHIEKLNKKIKNNIN